MLDIIIKQYLTILILE